MTSRTKRSACCAERTDALLTLHASDMLPVAGTDTATVRTTTQRSLGQDRTRALRRLAEPSQRMHVRVLPEWREISARRRECD